METGTDTDKMSAVRAKIKVGYKRRNPIEIALADPKSFRKAITAKCWDCSGKQWDEVYDCRVTSCPLHALRPQKNDV